jgi:hypothetical protein
VSEADRDLENPSTAKGEENKERRKGQEDHQATLHPVGLLDGHLFLVGTDSNLVVQERAFGLVPTLRVVCLLALPRYVQLAGFNVRVVWLLALLRYI